MNVGVLRILRTALRVRVGRHTSPLFARPTDIRTTSFDAVKSTIPDPPTNCCMSGCANCVWIEYANQLGHILQDRSEAAQQILNVIEDPSLRIFLSIELKDRLLANNKS